MHLWLNLINWTIDIQENIKIVKFYVPVTDILPFSKQKYSLRILLLGF